LAASATRLSKTLHKIGQHLQSYAQKYFGVFLCPTVQLERSRFGGIERAGQLTEHISYSKNLLSTVCDINK